MGTGAFHCRCPAFLTLVLGYWFFHKGPHSRIGRRITLGLRFTADKGYEATERLPQMVGQTGTAETPLRPSGRVAIHGEPYDAMTRGEFYEAGTPVKVIAVSSRQLVVEKEVP